MPIVGYSSNDENDFIYAIHENNMFNKDISNVSGDFSTRSECMGDGSNYCLPKEVDYAISIMGNIDIYNETFRAKLVVKNFWSEPDCILYVL